MAAVKPRDNIIEAVRDTVTVTPRKVVRSNTAIPQNSSTPPSSRAPQPSKRSHSQDAVTQAAAAVERSRSKVRPKKGSQHADVIDRLDFTGVGPMFHHDGPFDACAPSRNRHHTKAPMLAWSGDVDPNAAAAPRESPYAAASDTSYKNQLSNNYYDPPKKRVDAIAEAWGVHEPEPFEDFSAGGGREGTTPASSIYNGKDNGRAKRAKEANRDFLNEEPPRRSTSKRAPLPPPQPIFVPDANHPDLSDPLGSPSLAMPNAAPKRNKSIMSRIRKMRDSPNVPVADYETTEPSPPSPNDASGSYPGRPAHRSQNSFLGRFGGNKEDTSPTQEAYDRSKDLPATPYGQSTSTPYQDPDGLGYFDEHGYSSATGQTPGRKTTIMRKVKGVVRGGR
ncbi:hypothetical protein HWV62_23761 [Athelia sp. TMB]|nr:hypothetical protein HWV62_23761 [Athelia sp. TMB]